MKRIVVWKTAALLLTIICLAGVRALAQGNGSERRAAEKPTGRGSVRSVTIPVTVKADESRERREEFQQLSLTVLEDGEPQQILSARGADRAPLALAILIQDDLVSAGNEIAPLGTFIRNLPAGSRVLVGYLRAGSLQVRQRFTGDLERAAKSLRIPVGSPSAAPFNPYEQVYQGMKRFESLPAGTRRAALVVSDGLDISRGVDSSTPSQSVDLQRAINEAQRHGVAVYTIYSPTVVTNNNRGLASNAQSSLNRLTEETGGKSFFQGLGAPVSFAPFLTDLGATLNRQFALTYLSTHSQKGFHRLEVEAAQSSVEITHPSGTFRK